MCNMIVDTLDVIRPREHTYIRFLADGDLSGSSPAKDHVVPRRPGPAYPVSLPPCILPLPLTAPLLAVSCLTMIRCPRLF